MRELRAEELFNVTNNFIVKMKPKLYIKKRELTYPLDADKKMEIAFSCSFKAVPIMYLSSS